MAKMNYQKKNKFRHGSSDVRDERKSMGERWLEKHDPATIQHPHLTKKEKAERKQKRRLQKMAKKYGKGPGQEESGRALKRMSRVHLIQGTIFKTAP